MGTRLKPGRFDCHAAALDDEPRFTLLARDPLAGFLVSIWSSLRVGDDEAAYVKFRTMLKRVAPAYWIAPDVDASGEAIECAMAMFAWRAAHDDRPWRKEVDREPEPLVKALYAAVLALRSYQHGNSAPDLATNVADFGEEALAAAGYPSRQEFPGPAVTGSEEPRQSGERHDAPLPDPADAPAATAVAPIPASPGAPL